MDHKNGSGSITEGTSAMILIVEDDATFRRTIRDVLSPRFPFLIMREASDGIEAFREINAQLPAVVFMDIRLPGDNGLVLTKKIKEKYPEAVIAILTSYDQPEYRELALKNGATYFFLKGSIAPEEIVSVVEKSLFHKGNGFHTTSA
jgi:DNA-binding NarL/FixJ family response regulator